MPREIVQKWIKHKVNWKTVHEYYEHLDSLPIGPNIATLLGHSNLRAYVMGLERSAFLSKITQKVSKKMLLLRKYKK